jgi:hypothetical protein
LSELWSIVTKRRVEATVQAKSSPLPPQIERENIDVVPVRCSKALILQKIEVFKPETYTHCEIAGDVASEYCRRIEAILCLTF